MTSQDLTVRSASGSLASVGDVASFEELERVATVMAASGLFKGITRKESAMALMMLCQSEGLHYMQALRRYHIIEGTPSLRSEVMLADFMARGGVVKWIKRTDAEVTAFFSSKGCPEGATVTWDDARIARAGLSSKANHRAYPLAMKQARVISEGVKATDPAVIAGFYAPEEVMDFDNVPAAVVPATYPDGPPSSESQARIDRQEVTNAKALATPRKKREPVAPTRNWPAATPPDEVAAVLKASIEAGIASASKEAAGPEAPKASPAASGAPASSQVATHVPNAAAATATSATSAGASTTSGSTSATPLTSPPEREPGSDDDEPGEVIDAEWTDEPAAAPAGEFVDCYKRVRGFAFRPLTLDGRGPQPKRTLDQNAKMHALFAELEIKKEDTPASPATHGRVIEGIHTRIDKRFGKTSTADLSQDECSEIIEAMVKRIEGNRERYGAGTPEEKRERYRREGMIEQPDGTWRLPT